MPETRVGIGECHVDSDPECTLATYGLGSCIALAAWDPETHAAGLLHYMLPESGLDTGRGRHNPFLFADTGIPAMLTLLRNHRAEPERLVLRAAGGAAMLGAPSLFDVGEKNCSSLHRALARAGLRLNAGAVGGTSPRTLRLEVRTGRCWVEQDGRTLSLGVDAQRSLV
jgi:chemotaxis protein CheD